MRQGYADSILGDHEYCALCFRWGRPLQRHEVFHGYNRQRSKQYGLWISICYACHEEIHKDVKADLRLKEWAQRKAMEHYGWTIEDFRGRFGKNYVD